MIKYLMCLCLFLFSCYASSDLKDYAQKPERGIDGNDGKDGLNGAQGIKGEQGNDGPNVFIQGSRIKPKYSSVSFEGGTSYLYLGGQSNDPKSIIWVDMDLNIDCKVSNFGQIINSECILDNSWYCIPVKNSKYFIYTDNYQARYYPDQNSDNFFWVFEDQNCTIPYLTNKQIINPLNKYFVSDDNGCFIFNECLNHTTNISSAYYFDTVCKSIFPSFEYFNCVNLQKSSEYNLSKFAKANFTFEAK